ARANAAARRSAARRLQVRGGDLQADALDSPIARTARLRKSLDQIARSNRSTKSFHRAARELLAPRVTQLTAPARHEVFSGLLCSILSKLPLPRRSPTSSRVAHRSPASPASCRPSKKREL